MYSPPQRRFWSVAGLWCGRCRVARWWSWWWLGSQPGSFGESRLHRKPLKDQENLYQLLLLPIGGFWCISFGSFVCFIGQKSSSYPHRRDQTMQFCMVGHFQKKKLPFKIKWLGLVGFHDPLLVSLVFFLSIHPFGLLAEGTIDTTGFAASLGPQGAQQWTTVDGKNPSNQLIFSHYLQGFKHIQTVVGNGISEPSAVFHQDCDEDFRNFRRQCWRLPFLQFRKTFPDLPFLPSAHHLHEYNDLFPWQVETL